MSDRVNNVSIEVFQHDWVPGFAAFHDDGIINETAKAHVILNIGSLLAAVQEKDLDARDLPYMIAESLMHEVVHVLEAWAGIEFSEDRVEELLTKYREKYSRAMVWEYTGQEPGREATGEEMSLNRDEIVSQSTANCELCKMTPVPENYGSPRRCAWDQEGNFTGDNWNCETAGKLRTIAGEEWEDTKGAESLYLRRYDQSYAALYIPPSPSDVPDGDHCGPFRGGGFIAMSWYKHSGCTETIIRVDPRDGGTWDKAGLPLTLAEAEAALENLAMSTTDSG